MTQPPPDTAFTTYRYHITHGADRRYRLVPKNPTHPRPTTAYRSLETAIREAARLADLIDDGQAQDDEDASTPKESAT